MFNLLTSLVNSAFKGVGNGTPLQYSCLENSMDGGVWWAAVHGVAKSRTRLSDFIFIFHFHVLEKEMAPNSSTLAWKIPWMEEPGGLPSMGSHRVRHNWSDLAAAAATFKYPWTSQSCTIFIVFTMVQITIIFHLVVPTFTPAQLLSIVCWVQEFLIKI